MNLNVDLGDVFVKAWQIIWKFKKLWFLGFLVSTSGAINSIPAYFLQVYQTFPGNGSFDTQSFFSTKMMALVIVFFLFLMLTILFIYVSIIGQISAIKWIQQANYGAESLSLGQLWDESHNYFWRMFGLKLLIGIPALLPTLIGIGNVFLMSANTTNAAAISRISGLFFLLVSATFCFSIVLFVVNLTFIQAENAMVIEDLGILESLNSGWLLFKKNLVTIGLIAILLAVIGYVVSFIASIPVTMALPLFLFSFMAGPSTINMTSYLFPFLCLVPVLPLVLTINAIAEAYTQSVFTVTYLRLTAPAPQPLPQ